MAAITHSFQVLFDAALDAKLFSASARPAVRVKVCDRERDCIVRVAGRPTLHALTAARVELAFAGAFTLALRPLDANAETDCFPVGRINVLFRAHLIGSYQRSSV